MICISFSAVISKYLNTSAAGAETPKWAKATVYGSLAYFVLPADIVADFLPIAGYTDDLAVLTLALTTIGFYVDRDVKKRAAQTLARWFPVVSDGAAGNP